MSKIYTIYRPDGSISRKATGFTGGACELAAGHFIAADKLGGNAQVEATADCARHDEVEHQVTLEARN